MTYLITFSCYGNHLHGDERGSVDRPHHIYRSPLADADPDRVLIERTHLREQPYSIQAERREIVLDAIKEACRHRGWKLYAAHVRTTHVHVVVKGDARPEAVMNALKAYSSRALNRCGLEAGVRIRWARHGSTRWLWDTKCFLAAVEYVVRDQGETMAVYEATDA